MERAHPLTRETNPVLAAPRHLRFSYGIEPAPLSNSYAIFRIFEHDRDSRGYFDRGHQQERVVEAIEEPPSCPSNLVIVGRNSRGDWVAQETNGLFGGLFVSQAQAFKYALFENGHHPETIILATTPSCTWR